MEQRGEKHPTGTPAKTEEDVREDMVPIADSVARELVLRVGNDLGLAKVGQAHAEGKAARRIVELVVAHCGGADEREGGVAEAPRLR